MFRNIINDEFPETLTDALLHRFCGTLYFLEYDLGQDNSMVKANCLSWLYQYKKNNEYTAQQLWKELFDIISRGNPNGASYERTNLPAQISDLVSSNNAILQLEQIRRLSEESYELLEMVDDHIAGYSLPRTEILEKINESINHERFVIISGNPGMGKSAVAKRHLNGIRKANKGMVLCIKADELNDGNLRDYLAKNFGNYSLKEFFSCFVSFESNFIYVDSLEKLLETNGTAFKQLLTSIKSLNNVKLLMSCRQSSLPLLDLKFFNDTQYSRVDIQPLNEQELNLIVSQVEAINPLIRNPKLKSLLSIPKYLDFAYKALSINRKIDSNFNEDTFRDYLWQTIIENRIDESSNGLPQRRNKLFMNLSVKRSKKMRPFVSIDQPDELATERLLKENIIVQSRNKGFFAPAHDILEDWALVNHVDFLYQEHRNPDIFFVVLGNEPAMRRAYRLWIDRALQSNEPDKVRFVTQQILNISASGYWADECLIGLLHSEYCGTFFENHRSELLKNDFSLLLHFLRIMRTACRRDISDDKSKYYIPIGHGWAATIALIHQHIEAISINHWKTIYGLLKEWSNSIDEQIKPDQTTRAAGLIMLYLLENHIELGYRNGEEEVKLLVRFTGGIQQEITNILDEQPRDTADNEEDEYENDEKLKHKLIAVALSGYPSKQLAKYLPQTVISLLKENWMKTTCKVHYPQDDNIGIYHLMNTGGRSTDLNQYFGLNERIFQQCFPPSSQQTPTYWLLKYHWEQTIAFILELSNWCAENYSLSEFADRDKCRKLELIHPDGSKTIQIGSDLLWSVYRGTVKVSPYEWQSVLMALEKYLLNLCEVGIKNVEKVQNILEELFRKSNSVATTGLVSSILQAYPEFGAQHVSCLFSNRKFLSYDITRWVRDSSYYPIEVFANQHDRERKASADLPHRKKYQGGLQSFIQHYCFNYGTANQTIFYILDHHRKQADPTDLLWRKRLDELDIRTWKITKAYQENDKDGFLIEPSYSEDLKVYAAELKTSYQAINQDAAHASWLHQVEEGTAVVAHEKWQEIWNRYQEMEKVVVHTHRPGLLAKIGVEKLWTHLESKEKQWCEQLLTDAAVFRIDQANNPWSYDTVASPLDVTDLLKAFPILICQSSNENQRELEMLMFAFLTSPFQENDPHANELFSSFSKNIWEKNEALGIKMVSGLLQFAAFFKANAKSRYKNASREINPDYHQKYIRFVEQSIDKPEQMDIASLDLFSFYIAYLDRAIALLPNRSEHPYIHELLKTLSTLIIRYTVPKMYSDRDKHIGFFRITLRVKMADNILWNAHSLGPELLGHVIDHYTAHFKTWDGKDHDTLLESYKFTSKIIEQVIITADHHLHHAEESRNQHTIEQFLLAWTSFRNHLLRNNISIFSNLLLMDIEGGWKKTATNWKPISKDPTFFIGCIKLFGPLHPKAVINLLSHIGDEKLYKEGFLWLGEHFRKTGTNELISHPHIEMLLSRGYDNHSEEIVEDNTFLSEYLWLLDLLIAQGSSDAYWIREHMISFSPTK